MTLALENAHGGTFIYPGGTGGISATAGGNINTSGTNRGVVLIFVTGRSGNSPAQPIIETTGVTASGLTFTRVAHHDLQYDDPTADATYRYGRMSIDVFYAPAALQQTSVGWTCTLNEDDTVNNMTVTGFAVAGLYDIDNPFDPDGIFDAKDQTGVASTIAIPYTTSNANSLIVGFTASHQIGGGSGATPVLDTGFSYLDNEQPSGHSASVMRSYAQYIIASSPAADTFGNYANDYWSGVVLPFTGDNPLPPQVGLFKYEDPTITTNMTLGVGNIHNLVDVALDSGIRRAAPGVGTTWNPPIDSSADTKVLPATGGNRDDWIMWEYDEPVAVGLLEYRASHAGPLGMWQLQGSVHGSTWTDLGYPFELGGSSGNSVDVPLPYGDSTAPGGRLYRGIDPDFYTSTLFWPKFRIIGVSDFIASFPWELIPTLRVWCLNLRSAHEDAAHPGTSADIEYSPSIPPEPDGVLGYDVGDTPPVDPPPTPDPDIPGPIPPATATYFGPYATGERTGNGLITASYSSAATQFGGIASGFDNNWSAGAGNGPYYGSFSPGDYFEFEFDQPIFVTEATFWADGPYSVGDFKFQGSVDGTTFTDISSSAELVFGATDDATGLAPCTFVMDVAAGSYLSYRMVATTATATARTFVEAHFKTIRSPLEAGDRRTGSDAVAVSSNTIISGSWDDLVDGIKRTYNGGQYPSGVGSITFTTAPVANDYIQFDFPRVVALRRMFVQVANPDDGAGTHFGTWKWQGSDDGSSWTNVGSACVIEPTSAGEGYFDGGNITEAYPYWRLTKVSGTTDTSSPWYQFEFDLADTGEEVDPPTVPNVTTFEDDGRLEVLLTTRAPVDSYTVRLTDDSTLSATVTLHINVRLSAVITDDTELDVFSSLSPSSVVQSFLIRTGR